METPPSTLPAHQTTYCDAIALVDCQNFYVSCERVFRPDLRDRPVAVLSNNDGCIIARSEEVKAAGIKMAAPFFKYRDKLEALDAVVFSSNYELYADMSRRVMQAIGSLATGQELYSIDECFLSLPRLDHSGWQELGWRIRKRADEWTGLPVRVGIGPTKTLAKIANLMARNAETGGAYVFPQGDQADAILEQVAVGDIWGIGSAREEQLTKRGLNTALDLRNLPDAWLRKHMTVVGQRTAWELRGTPCAPVGAAPPARKSLVRSRSFSECVEDIGGLRESIARHTSRAAEKLRKQGLAARGLQVFITTRKFTKGPFREAARSCTLSRSTNYTPELLQAAIELLQTIYEPGYGYKKAGIMVYDLTKERPTQGHLFMRDCPEDRRLMRAVDELNESFGKNTVHMAARGTSRRDWRMRRNQKSPCYTTRWRELPALPCLDSVA